MAGKPFRSKERFESRGDPEIGMDHDLQNALLHWIQAPGHGARSGRDQEKPVFLSLGKIKLNKPFSSA